MRIKFNLTISYRILSYQIKAHWIQHVLMGKKARYGTRQIDQTSWEGNGEGLAEPKTNLPKIIWTRTNPKPEMGLIFMNP